jgi:hypothetical protein
VERCLVVAKTLGKLNSDYRGQYPCSNGRSCCCDRCSAAWLRHRQVLRLSVETEDRLESVSDINGFHGFFSVDAVTGNSVLVSPYDRTDVRITEAVFRVL